MLVHRTARFLGYTSLYLALSSAAFAQDVTLSSNDGSISVTGQLLDFENGTYTVQTPLGPFVISAARVRCEGDACPVIEVTNADVRISGSETVGEELMPMILAGYASQFGAEADVQTGNNAFEKVVNLIGEGGFGDEIASYALVSEGTDSGVRDLEEGRSELAMMSRPIRPDEVERFESSGFGNLNNLTNERIVAVDSLRIIVSQDNPIEAITMDQLAGIYGGQISNWSQLGGPNEPINVYSRAKETGTFDILSQKLLRPRRLSAREDATIVSGNIEMASTVASDPFGIGFVGYAFERGAKTLPIITECNIPVSADAFSAKTEEYPLQRRLYVYAKAENLSEEASGLFDFMATSSVDQLVEKAGFVDLGITKRAQDDIADRLRAEMDQASDPWEVSLMRELYIAMLEWDRLSTTFRFTPASSELDNKARRDLDRVIDYIASIPNAEVTIAGFTDSQGAFGANLVLSERRAAQVADQLTAAAGDRLADVNLNVKGFGELAPTGCNESFEGRRINRRVEIWVTKPNA